MGPGSQGPSFPSRTAAWCSSHCPIPDRSPLIPSLLPGATRPVGLPSHQPDKTLSPTRTRFSILLLVDLPALFSSRPISCRPISPGLVWSGLAWSGSVVTDD